MNSRKQLERKLSRFAIHDLTLYLVGGQGLALLLGLGMPAFIGAIQLVPALVLRGEWWRVLSFVFTPPSGSPLFAVIALYFLFFLGRSLEAQWGAARYNLYVLIGFVMTVACAFAFPYHGASNVYITGSIFLAFAYLYPRYEILLFFILPVQVRFLAAITWVLYAYEFLVGGWAERVLILAAITNFLVFFGRDIVATLRYGQRRVVRQAAARVAREQVRHSCTVCGVTDKSNPTMDFRYCRQCEPPLCYCRDHLGNHEHVQTGLPPP